MAGYPCLGIFGCSSFTSGGSHWILSGDAHVTVDPCALQHLGTKILKEQENNILTKNIKSSS